MSLNINVIGQTKKLELNPTVFGCEFNEPLVHQVVTSYMTNIRSGTKAQKTRREVRGGGIKPWRQKGTGRARAGSIRSPIWRGGGKVFAAKTREFNQKVNKKMYQGAMRSILSELIRQERIVVIDKILIEEPKTKVFLQKVNSWLPELPNRVTFLLDSFDENLYLSSRNLPQVNICDFSEVDPVVLISSEKVIISPEILKKFEEVLA